LPGAEIAAYDHQTRRVFINFDGDPEDDTTGDLGAEASFVIPISDSPTQEPLLVVPNEVSGTTSVFRIANVK
jgi:hypothetical protein